MLTTIGLVLACLPARACSSAPLVQTPHLPVAVTSVARNASNDLDVTLRNDGDKTVIGWTLRVDLDRDFPGGPRTFHSGVDGLRESVLSRLDAEFRPPSTSIIPPSTSLSVRVAVGDPWYTAAVTVVVVLFDDGTGVGDELYLERTRQYRERMAAAIDRWLPVLEATTKRPTLDDRRAFLRQELRARRAALSEPHADDEYPALVDQLLANADRNPSGFDWALAWIIEHLRILRVEARRGSR